MTIDALANRDTVPTPPACPLPALVARLRDWVAEHHRRFSWAYLSVGPGEVSLEIARLGREPDESLELDLDVLTLNIAEDGRFDGFVFSTNSEQIGFEDHCIGYVNIELDDPDAAAKLADRVRSAKELRAALAGVTAERDALAHKAAEDLEVLWDYDGKEVCDEELALSALLKAGVLFANERDYSMTFNGVAEGGSTVVLFVICSDVFAWGCADAEDLPHSEIGALYRAHKSGQPYGVTKWCCLRRNMQPQTPVKRKMIAAGAWDEAMGALPENPDAERYRELARKQEAAHE